MDLTTNRSLQEILDDLAREQGEHQRRFFEIGDVVEPAAEPEPVVIDIGVCHADKCAYKSQEKICLCRNNYAVTCRDRVWHSEEEEVSVLDHNDF